ncbi:MAG: UDP-N-acetylmuramoyl-tripeptide--D-alanyl-D-alanine ligase [Candidatus Babeliales bacterium]
MRFDEHFIKGALPEVSLIQAVFPDDPHFAVDTRTLKAGDIFIALSGSVVDGHDFIKTALERGAGGLMLAADKKSVLDTLDPELLKNKLIMLVPDTLAALIRISCAWRAQFRYPVIAITGSVGKTSTKELVAHMCALQGLQYVASHGNQNTKIGLSLNMLRMRPYHQVAIFEVGINKRGEMAELARMVKPTTAIITNIGHTHMEGLGSLADIATEKRDLFKFFTEESIGIINGDQPVLAQVGYIHPVIKFGTKTTNQIQARKIQTKTDRITFVLKIYKEKFTIEINNVHSGAIFNALAATVAAHMLGIPNDVIIKAIQTPPIVAGRFELKPLKEDKGIIINDCYNANPESMKAALLAFQKIETKAQKIAVLGDMLELGLNSPFWHRQLGRFLRKVPSLRHVVLVGDMMKWAKKTIPVGLTVVTVANWQEAIIYLEGALAQESLVLVKGSRGMGLTNVVTALSSPSAPVAQL